MGKDEVLKTPARKTFSCNQCGKGFKLITHLHTHERHHAKKSQHVCRICKRSFLQLYHLTVHLKSHTGEKLFHCDECGKSFAYPNHLSRHQRGHRREDSDQCGTRFKSKLGLHVQGKQRGVNTRCKYCGEDCHSIYNLKRHYESHTTEKPFRCDQCGKRFGAKAHLSEHKLTHSTVKPFTCKHCGRGFIRKRGLKAHTMTHVEERPKRKDWLKQKKAFICEDCGTVVKVRCSALSNVFSVTSVSDVKCFIKNHTISPL